MLRTTQSTQTQRNDFLRFHRYLLVARQPDMSTLTLEKTSIAKLGLAVLVSNSAWGLSLSISSIERTEEDT